MADAELHGEFLWLLRHAQWSSNSVSAKSPAFIALSTSDAECFALVSATATSLGLVQLAADLGLELTLQHRCDASGCMVAATRLGLGRAMHLPVGCLWVESTFGIRIA